MDWNLTYYKRRWCEHPRRRTWGWNHSPTVSLWIRQKTFSWIHTVEAWRSKASLIWNSLLRMERSVLFPSLDLLYCERKTVRASFIKESENTYPCRGGFRNDFLVHHIWIKIRIKTRTSTILNDLLQFAKIWYITNREWRGLNPPLPYSMILWKSKTYQKTRNASW